jgi:hypothetical protein
LKLPPSLAKTSNRARVFAKIANRRDTCSTTVALSGVLAEKDTSHDTNTNRYSDSLLFFSSGLQAGAQAGSKDSGSEGRDDGAEA